MDGSFKDLKVYQMSYALAMEIFHLSKTIPSVFCPKTNNRSKSSSTLVLQSPSLLLYYHRHFCRC
jgi:hypothetical protein